MKFIKRVNLKKTYEYVTSTGEKKTRYLEMYYVIFDNGVMVPVKPIFAKDYNTLNILSEKVVVGKEDKKEDLPF